MGPALRSAIPGRNRRTASSAGPDQAAARRAGAGSPRLTGLTRRARLVVTVWAMLAAPTILFNLVGLVVSAPFVLPRTARAVWRQLAPAGPAIGDGNVLAAVADVVAAAVLALPAVGMLFVLFLLGRTVVRVLRGRRRRQVSAGGAKNSRAMPSGSRNDSPLP
jgi:putative peptide zinc metalloprotease protein